MKPTIAVDITSRDKTSPGRRSAERGFESTSKKLAGFSDKAGITKLGRQLDGLTRFRTLSFGFDSAGRSLSMIGRTSLEVGQGVATATSRMVGFGAASESALGTVASGAGLALGGVVALGAAIGGVAVGTYMLGEKWAKTGAEIDRTARTIGMSARALQADRAAAERFGVTADATTASLDSLGSTLYDAQYGANNLALGALNQLGIKLKKTKDGAVDVQQAMLDIADAIARQKDPQVQKKLASVFGLSAMLPALRQGSAVLKREGADYLASKAALTDAEVARSEDLFRKTTTFRQHLGGAEKDLGMRAESGTARMLGDNPGALADRGVGLFVSAEDGVGNLGKAAKSAAAKVESAAGKLARVLDPDYDFDRFAGRIERQESGGRQFDKDGRPLTSSRGAVGVMQMLPETAERAARRAGIAWDPKRFARDPDYNRMLGRAELKRLFDKYGGDQVLAAAAYNAGEGRLDRPYLDKQGRRHTGWLERFGDPRKGEISDAAFAAAIPFRETRDYVGNTAGTAKAQVEIVLKNAPPGTVAKATGAPGLDVDMRIARSLEGP